jgi:hypothetical protein
VATLDVRTFCTVPGMSVLASLAIQSPVLTTLEGFGAKQDWPLFSSIADAKAPEERSCRICNPGAFPENWDSLI